MASTGITNVLAGQNRRTEATSSLWPPCIADADTIFLLCGFFFFFLSIFLPRLFSAIADWMSTILPHSSANLGCRSEMYKQLAENTGRKKSPKIHHLGTISQLCQAISSQLRHVSTILKKIVKQQYPFHMFSQYSELRPITG